MEENKKIFVIPHFHYDLAWRETEKTYLKKAFKVIEKALYFIEKFPPYKYVLDQTYYLEKLKSENPQLFKAVKNYVEEGRIEIVNAGYVMLDLNLPSPITLKKAFSLANKFAEKEFGVKPTTAWMIDCFGHPAIMPRIVKESGMKYYVFWRGMPATEFPQEFIWEGYDGTKILTHWLKDFSLYGGKEKKLMDAVKKCRPSTSVAAVPFGGDFYIPEERLIEDVLKTENAFFATPSEFFKEIEKHEEKLPVLKGDLLSEYENFNGVYSSRIRYKQLFRSTEKRVVESKASEEEWKTIIRAGFHDLICGTALDEIYLPFEKELQNLRKRLGKKSKLKFKQVKFPKELSLIGVQDRGDLYFSREVGEKEIYRDAKIKVGKRKNTFKITVDTYFNKPYYKLLLLIKSGFKPKLYHFLNDCKIERELDKSYALTGVIEIHDVNGREKVRVWSDDCFEYKVSSDGNLYFTLVRGTSIFLYEDPLPCPRAQEPGKHKFRIFVEMLDEDR